MAFLAPVCLFGQVTAVNLGLVEGAPNVMYQGIEHRMKIIGVDSAAFLGLDASSGKVYPSYKWDEFTVYAGLADTLTLTIRCVGQPDTKVVFAVEHWVNPIAWLGSLQDTVASVDEILADPILHAPMPGTYMKEYFQVFAFELKLIGRDGKLLADFPRTHGNQLSRAHTKKIKKLKHGDVLKFSCTATCPDCTLRRLPDLNIHVR